MGDNQMGDKRMPLILVSFFLFVLGVIGMAHASQLTMKADPINYYANTTHNITVNYTGATFSNGLTINVTIPGELFNVSVISGHGCSLANTDAAGRNITCTNIVNTGTVIWFTVTHHTSTAEFNTTTLFAVLNDTNKERSKEVKLINISQTNVLDTLVELGRGRGAYIYSTRYGGSKQDNGTTFIPANTRTQLWYLHRVYNIGPYLGVHEDAKDIVLHCNYTGRLPVVSKHPTKSNITNSTVGSDSRWYVNYTFDGTLGTSFWKMGWTALEPQRTGGSVLNDGNSVVSNCTVMNYTLSSGIVFLNRTTSTDSVNLTAATVAPLTVTATSSNSTVFRGQSENLVYYNITNTGRYKIHQLQVEFDAPTYTQWIGTRGELFGTGLEKYVVELPELASGESFNVTLAARFDVPSSATDGSTINLGTWDAKFLPPWELVAYAPIKLEQNDNTISATVSLNMNSTTAITAVRGATDTIITELGRIREFLDELAFLVTDSVGGDSEIARQPDAGIGTEVSATSSSTQRTGGSFSGGNAIQVTQTLVNNAWLIVILIAIGVAGYLIIGGKQEKRTPRSAHVIYKPMIHG